VGELTIGHVDQLDDYARTYHATHRMIAVPSGTFVSDDVNDHMDDLEIDLMRTRFQKRVR